MRPPPTFQLLWPVRDRADPFLPILAALDEYLAEPATVDQLEELETDRSYPARLLATLREIGLGSLFTERSGAVVTAYHLAALAASTARSSGSVAITVCVNALALLPVYLVADAKQRASVEVRVRQGAACSLLLTELDHGSNLLANQTLAERGVLDAQGDFRPISTGGAATHYRLTGTKNLINGGTHHDILVVLARTPSGAQATHGMGEFSVFLVYRDGTVTSGTRWRTLPAPAADISDVHFSGTVVPAENRLGGEGDGFSLIQRTLSISRGAISALASGSTSQAREIAVDYAARRHLYGKPILTLGAVKEHVRKMEALDAAVAALSVKQAAMVNARGLGAAYYTAAAKFACCALAEEAVTEGRHVLSARALVSGLRYDRLVGDVLLYGVFDGTRHLMLDQLQWRLTQLAARDDGSATDTLAELRQIYATPPTGLPDVLRQRARPLLLPLSAHARALARQPGILDLEPLAELALALLVVTRRLRELRLWDDDQALRFDAGAILGILEALLALAELCDPGRREALGLPLLAHPAEWMPGAAAFALSWLGARTTQQLRSLAYRAGLENLPDLDAIERTFLAHSA